MKVFILNTGGTLGMVGNPLQPAKSAEQLMDGITLPTDVETTLEDFPLRQDSTNVMHADRVAMGEQIARAYETHDAFIVLHGTDSLAETLSFFCMLFKLSLQKPLFVIGAQMTKDEAGSDVPMQIANTVRVAKAFLRQEIVGVYSVCLGSVLDGSRVRKRRDSDFDAFHTPGRHPVAQAWPHVMFKPGVRKRDPVAAVQGLRMDPQFERHVVTLVASADAPPYVLMDMVKAGRIRGVLIECKGAGNIPDREWDFGDEGSYSWIDAIQAATNASIHVGIVSPFEDGRVILSRYELGQKAADAGALSMGSLTPAMADVKFRQGITMHPTDPKRIEEFVLTSIVGEHLEGFEDLDD